MRYMCSLGEEKKVMAILNPAIRSHFYLCFFCVLIFACDEAFFLLQNGFLDCLINVLQMQLEGCTEYSVYRRWYNTLTLTRAPYPDTHLHTHTQCVCVCRCCITHAPSSIPDDMRRLNFSHDSLCQLQSIVKPLSAALVLIYLYRRHFSTTILFSLLFLLSVFLSSSRFIFCCRTDMLSLPS